MLFIGFSSCVWETVIGAQKTLQLVRQILLVNLHFFLVLSFFVVFRGFFFLCIFKILGFAQPRNVCNYIFFTIVIYKERVLSLTLTTAFLLFLTVAALFQKKIRQSFMAVISIRISNIA